MSQTTKYMELNSNYRNRNLFETPAEFEVGISQTGMKTNIGALDPITYSYPEIVFVPNNFTSLDLIVSGVPYTSPSVIDNTSAGSILIVEPDVDVPINVNGYYKGAVIIIVADDGTTNNYTVRRRVIDWTVLNSGKYQVTLDSVIPDNIFLGSSVDAFSTIKCVIRSPDDITDITRPYLFIPTGLDIENYYNKYVVWNQTLNVSIPILSYDKVTHLALLGNIPLSFALSDVLVIRKVSPSEYGTLATTSPTVSRAYDIVQQVSESLVNSFLRLYLTASPNPIDTGTGNVNPNANVIRKIVKVLDTNTVVLDEAIPSLPATNWQYEIMNFSIDNYSPFIFTGSMSSQNQPVAHEISLSSLVLPNVYLKNGGRIAYYPYVYVEIENLSATTSSSKNIIYSNNPYTHKAIFKVPITDLNHPSISPFVKLTGNGMKQTMAFKQNDNMRVAVRLPNGEIFKTIKNDTSYGQEPNTFLQTSFCFGIERI